MMAQWAFRSASLVIAVSQGQQQRLQQSFHRRGALVVVPNMVDTDRFVPTPLPPDNEGYRLLFIGLLDTDQKGVHVLLAALAHLQQYTTLWVRCDLVGDGKLRAEYEAQAHQLGLSSMVTFHGLKPHQIVAQMLQQSHALVLPSLHEAAPMVIIEALASGRPVISTRCGGPEFMLDEATGLIVEPGDSRELAQAIAYLLSHINQYDPDYIAASAVMRYGKAAVTSSLSDVYSAVLRDASPAPNL
jgi:glycosyltransferase involved in cell wall biosynthesis